MAIYYIDNVRGNDSNSGLTKDLAWKNPSKIYTELNNGAGMGTLAAGDSFLFEAQSVWNLTSNIVFGGSTNKMNGTVGSRITFDRYDYSTVTTSKPIFTLEFTPVSSDWTRDTGTIDSVSIDLWYCVPPSFALGSIPRVTVNNTLCEVTYHTYTGFHRGVLPSTDNQVMSQESPSGKLYIWTPVGVNPEDYYGVGAIKYSPSVSTHAIFRFYHCGSYITMQNLEARNAPMLASVWRDDFSTDPCTNFIFQNNRTQDTASAFVTLCNPTNHANGIVNLEIKDNEIVDAAGYGMQVGYVYTGITISGNTINGASLAKTDGGGVYAAGPALFDSTGLVIEDNYFTRCNYNSLAGSIDGSAIYLEIRTSGAIVRRNTIYLCPQALQDNSGCSNLWYSNLIINCDKVLTVTDASNYASTSPTGMNIKFYNNTAINTTLDAIYLPFGTVRYNTRFGIITLMDSTTAAAGFYTADFRNNIIHGIGTSITSGDGVRIDTKWNTNINFKNNSIYGTQDVYSNGSGTLLGTPATTITSDPKVRADGAVSLGSPCIKAGTSTGLTLTDFENNLFGITPTVGAFEFNAFRDIEGFFE